MFIMHLYRVRHKEKLVMAGIAMENSIRTLQEGSEKSDNEFESLKIDLDTSEYKLATAYADQTKKGRLSHEWWSALYDFMEKQNEKDPNPA